VARQSLAPCLQYQNRLAIHPGGQLQFQREDPVLRDTPCTVRVRAAVVEEVGTRLPSGPRTTGWAFVASLKVSIVSECPCPDVCDAAGSSASTAAVLPAAAAERKAKPAAVGLPPLARMLSAARCTELSGTPDEVSSGEDEAHVLVRSAT
jgi:hypothetical protein